ncbi:MAG: DUF6597 domain-containing transcriptional factor [Candidatus Saccharimonadales bacterium]
MADGRQTAGSVWGEGYLVTLLAKQGGVDLFLEGKGLIITSVSIYKPLQLGIPTQYKQHVSYKEFYPRVKSPVYCFWSLYAREVLKEDFHYLVLPDACVDIVFDMSQKPTFEGALVMTPCTVASTLNLGKEFSYVGIRLLPGAWQEQPSDVVGQALHLSYLKDCDFRRMRQELQGAETGKRHTILEGLVTSFEQRGVISVTSFGGTVSPCQTVEAYTRLWNLSRRHTQRLFQRRFGYAPHDFIKITRFQQSLRQGTFDAYTDQAHYIREFKRITTMTPREFQATYR